MHKLEYDVENQTAKKMLKDDESIPQINAETDKKEEPEVEQKSEEIKAKEPAEYSIEWIKAQNKSKPAEMSDLAS